MNIVDLVDGLLLLVWYWFEEFRVSRVELFRELGFVV